MAYNVVEKEIRRKINRIDKKNPTHRVYECPICGNGMVHIENTVFYGRCGSCASTMIDFEPLQHQMDYLYSPTTYKLLIGGFGSGKTTISCFDDVYHALTVPNARILITAPTLQQMKAAILPELDKFIPPWFLIGGKSKGNPPVYTFTNGSEIYVYASDNEQKMRSLNLSRFHIEEGSGVDKSIFDQLQARLRNSVAVIKDSRGNQIGDRFSGVISTNPEDAWIKDDFLLKSGHIQGSPSVDASIYEPLRSSERIAMFETFVSASFDNTMLPKGTIERISAGKDERWKRKYLWSYLDSREGLVYGEINKHFVEPFEIPKDWQRIGGYDPGISDPTATLIGAIDPKTGVIYYYDEYYVRDETVTYHGLMLKPKIDPYSWYRPLSADPSVNKRSQETGVAYRVYFKQQTGITLNAVNNSLLLGIDKVRDYLYNNKIKFFNSLVEFKREASIYAFPSPESKQYKNTNNVPIDKDNHLMDCLRYSVMPLPNDPTKFRGTYIQDDILKASNVFQATEQAESRRIIYGFKRN